MFALLPILCGDRSFPMPNTKVRELFNAIFEWLMVRLRTIELCAIANNFFPESWLIGKFFAH